MRRILISVTTTRNSDWRAKIKEINKFKLKEAAIFPTCLNKKERKELYGLLEKSTLKTIPFVHIRSDMELEELDYLIKKFRTKAFNMHTNSEFPFRYNYLKYKRMIFIENVFNPLNGKEIKKFGGICLDTAHLEDDRLQCPEQYEHNIRMIEKYKVGCNHISCAQKVLHLDEVGCLGYDTHFLRKFSQLNYLKNFPKKCFSPIIAIELENTIEKQLEARDYLTRKIGL